MRERYETVINGKRYTFDVKFDGHVWIARAFKRDRFKLVACAASCSAENVLLRLVKQVEYIKSK